jgi:exopolysaccharide biosynthesis protein
MSLKFNLKTSRKQVKYIVETVTIDLPEGNRTKVHVARFLRSQVRPRVIVFDKPVPLLTWCKENGIQNAINAGFSMHHKDKLLGEIWTAGKKHNSVMFSKPWHSQRGSVHISRRGHIKIAPRHFLNEKPEGDLLQAGPLLVHHGESLIMPDVDPEGISASSHQFDDDWTGNKRFPRAAIGSNEDFIYCVATDGYSPSKEAQKNAGLSLGELAEVMVVLGATEALNLDGGSSATLVCGGKLMNKPRAGKKDNYEKYPIGRQIPNAIILEPR